MREDLTYRDQELFRRIAQGDQAAFTAFFEAYSVKLAIYVSRLFNSELWGEEVVQDVFLKLWTIRETIGDIEAPAGFIYRMTANRAKDLLKSQEHKVKLQYYIGKYLTDSSVNYTQEHIDYRTIQRLFSEAVQQLPAKRAQIYKMRHEQGLGYDEIARQLNISKHTVRAQLNFTMQHLRNYLMEKGDFGHWLCMLLYLKIIF